MSLKKSPWIIHYDGSSCNGCDIETIACLTPLYDVERMGILNMGNPKHADVFLITGAINEQNKPAVRNIYEQMPDPKVVVAIGICATSGGIFSECYNVAGGVDKVIPVDVYVPGCAARPEAIIDGINEALKILEEKSKKLKEMASGAAEITLEKAAPDDAGEILALQKLAYQSETEFYGDFAIPILTETIEAMREDFKHADFFKAVMHGRIIGSVCVVSDGPKGSIERLIVNPVYRHHGVGRKLIEYVEKHFAEVNRFEVSIPGRSRRNIIFYEGLRFQIFKKEKTSDGAEKVYMKKEVHKWQRDKKIQP